MQWKPCCIGKHDYTRHTNAVDCLNRLPGKYWCKVRRAHPPQIDHDLVWRCRAPRVIQDNFFVNSSPVSHKGCELWLFFLTSGWLLHVLYAVDALVFTWSVATIVYSYVLNKWCHIPRRKHAPNKYCAPNSKVRLITKVYNVCFSVCTTQLWYLWGDVITLLFTEYLHK